MQWQCAIFQQARQYSKHCMTKQWSLCDTGKILIQLLNDELFLELAQNNWKQVNDDQTITQHSIILDKTNLYSDFIFSLA